MPAGQRRLLRLHAGEYTVVIGELQNQPLSSANKDMALPMLSGNIGGPAVQLGGSMEAPAPLGPGSRGGLTSTLDEPVSETLVRNAALACPCPPTALRLTSD